ncbi:MAG: DUF1492 domain-containing protein [Firmicutes bacterium]|nr:DUF1492 domain-containing protein [Bacillota bacterium]
MTAKEFLSQAWDLNREIKAKESQIRILREQATRVHAVILGDKVQTSPQPDRVGDIVARITDLAEDYAMDVERLRDVKAEIHSAINKVSRAKYRAVLTERYINFKRWEDIAAENKYSWKTVHRIHAAALKEIVERLT